MNHQKVAFTVMAFVVLSCDLAVGCSSSSTKSSVSVVTGRDGGSDAACTEPGPLLESDCDPIGGFCGFPFPSDVYLGKDTTGKNPSGKAIAFRAGTLPVIGAGDGGPNTTPKGPIDPSLFTGLDGWSPASTAMVYLPGATATGLASPLQIVTTIDPSSLTIILDTGTGRLVPHWVDIDQQGANDAQRAVMLHPAVLLTNGSRYIVAIRGVKDSTGTTIPPTDAFKALRDGTSSPDASVGSRRCLYQGIFAKLAAAGVKRDDLQVAWDFTVGTRDSITGPLVKVRDAALAAVGADGPAFAIAKNGNGVEQVTENPNPHIMRRIIITMKAPLYLTSATYTPGDPVPRLEWDASGTPKQNGTMDVDILIQIPNAAKTAKLGLLQNGHGLFGGKEEQQDGVLAIESDNYHYVELAVDFFGFASADVPMAAEGLGGRPEVFPGFVDRQIQGHVNQLVAMRLMMGSVAKNGIKDASGKLVLDPAWIDPTLRIYRGDSQGGIMGGTYMSVSTDVTRGYLGEPGTPYSVLLNRSNDATLYNAILAGTYGDGRAVQLLWGLIQLYWDRSEPSGFVPFMTNDTLPNTPPHHVLIHCGIGDHQVTTLGAQIMARAVGAKLLQSNDPNEPVVRDVFGLEQAPAPLQDTSALVEWDFNLGAEPLTNIADTNGCDPHDRIRQLTPAYEQQDEFFRTGKIDWFCDGVCNCDSAHEETGCSASYKNQCCNTPTSSTDPKCQ